MDFSPKGFNMKKLLLLFLSTLLASSLAFAQIGTDLNTTLDALSDFALSSGVNDEGQIFYSLEDTEFRLEVQRDLVKRMDGTSIMDEAGIAFASKLFAVATGYGDDIETGFITFFTDNLENLSKETEPLVVPIDQFFTMGIEVTGDEAPYSASYSLYLEEIAEEDFPSTPYVKGSEDAAIVIREFSDLQCPACQRFHQETMPYIQNLVDEGKVRFEFHHLPLASIHANAIGAARAIECVAEYNGDEGFWTYHDELFERQRAWENLDDPSNYFVRLSDELGLETDEIKTCITELRYDDLIAEAMIKATDLGLNSTPSVFVNGYRIGNWVDTANFEQTMILATAFDDEAEEATE